MHRRLAFVVVPLIVLVTVGVLADVPAAAAGPVRDVSFPQCGTTLPASARGGIIGVNGGRLFTRNPCLATQLGWAKTLREPPSFYANTGNPGPAHMTHWPIGQTSPQSCSAQDPNSLGCSYDYGFNGAIDSFQKAMDGAQQWNGYDRATARRRVA